MYDFLGIDVPSSPASVIDDLDSAFSCSFCDGRHKPVSRSFIAHEEVLIDCLGINDPNLHRILVFGSHWPSARLRSPPCALAQMGGKHGYAAVDTTPDTTMQDLKVARVTLFGLIAYKQRLFSP
jgi:hypothetical protein